MTKITRIFIAASIFFIHGCASNPQKAQNKLTETYKRTKPIASEYYGEIGIASYSSITVQFSNALIWRQSRTHCDQKPVRVRNENHEQQVSQQALIKRNACSGYSIDIWKCAIESKKLRNLQSSQFTIEYKPDCYVTPPTNEETGNLLVRIVNKSDAVAQYKNAPILDRVVVSNQNNNASLAIPESISATKCLILTNTDGTPVAVRSNSGNDYTFITDRMKRERERLNLLREIDLINAKISQTREKISSIENEMRADENFSGSSCKLPPQKAIPPEPNGMTLLEVRQQAEGYCFEKLASDLNPELVSAYVRRYDESHLDSYKAYRRSRASCTYRAYEYDSSQTFLLRVISPLNPRESEGPLVIQLLKNCTDAVMEKCGSHIIAWVSKVNQIKSEPMNALKACEQRKISLSNLYEQQATNIKTKEDLNQSLRANLSENNQPPTVNTPLSDAACK